MLGDLPQHKGVEMLHDLFCMICGFDVSVNIKTAGAPIIKYFCEGCQREYTLTWETKEQYEKKDEENENK